MIDSAINVMKALLGMSDQFRQVKAERRDKVVKYLNNVSDCASRIALALRNGETPYSACGELASYCEKLPELVRDELDPEQIRKLRVLQEGVKRLPGEAIITLPRKTSLKKTIATIEVAAGKLKALAVSFEVSE